MTPILLIDQAEKRGGQNKYRQLISTILEVFLSCSLQSSFVGLTVFRGVSIMLSEAEQEYLPRNHRVR